MDAVPNHDKEMAAKAAPIQNQGSTNNDGSEQEVAKTRAPT